MSEHLVQEIVYYLLNYGIFGLFLIALIGSTVFIPMSVEVFMAALAGLKIDPYLILFVASLGSLLGNVVNYFVGRVVGKRVTGKWKKDKTVKKMEEIVKKYGYAGLFVLIALPLPLPVDVLTVLAGIIEMDLKWFVLAIFLGKLVHYSFFLGIINMVI